ncbi:MAG TPA: MOSC domain-containing protein [Planctomycetota bacterium]|nr:MOSC domain-containing protein [Planctomycetota bacterium]
MGAESQGVPGAVDRIAPGPRLERIWIKRRRREATEEVARATLLAGSGIDGNADRGGRRQVTILSLDRWRELMAELGSDLDPRARRANLLVSGIELAESRGRVLAVGNCALRIRGETRPCERMDEALPGLREAMRARWGGGVFAEVVRGGEIAVGDAAAWEE